MDSGARVGRRALLLFGAVHDKQLGNGHPDKHPLFQNNLNRKTKAPSIIIAISDRGGALG